MDVNLIKTLGLQVHPEGGYYKQTYVSQLQITTSDGKTRQLATAIYYYLESDDYSSWHRLQADEIWHYYSGSTLTLHMIDEHGKLTRQHLGNPAKGEGVEPQVIIPANVWFAAEVDCIDSYTLVGCIVIPGFAWEDFELGKVEDLVKQYPKHKNIIERLTRR